MIKAKKGLLAALFAVMMVVAFVPAMAFAADGDDATGTGDGTSTETPAAATATDKSEDAVWDLTNHTVTIDGVKYEGVTVTFNMESGTTTARFDYGTGDAAIYAEDVFYDLNGAEIYQINSAAVSANYTLTDYKALDDKAVTLTLKKPAYATSPTTANAKADGITPNGWALKTSVVDLEESTASQSGTISVLFTANTTHSVLENNNGVTKSVNVLGQATTPALKLDDNTANFATEAAAGSYTSAYDGNAHTLVATEVAGWAVAYQKFNSTTGKWDAIDTISFRNVADNGSYRAAYTKGTETKYVQATVNMTAKAAFQFYFTADLGTAGNIVPAGTDPVAFIRASVATSDEEEALKYFNDVYEVKVVANAADSSIETWSVVAKEGVKAKDIYAAYENLSKNYSLTAAAVAQPTTNAKSGKTITRSAAINTNTAEDDITFTKAANVTYKAKKKTKKLAKTKSFTVAAEADSGNAITYKMTSPNAKISINATTGKITVKKGIKKGTYKVTVKAKTAAGNGYKAAKESVQLTIKIK